MVKVPTLVKLELTTFGASVLPVNVPASTVTLIGALPSNGTPLMFLGVASFVAFAARSAVAAFPVMLPVMGLVKIFTPPTVWLVLRSTKFWVEDPVPPLATGNIPVTPVASGNPVAPVKTAVLVALST